MMMRREVARARWTGASAKARGHRHLGHGVARSAGLLLAVTWLWSPVTAAGSALGKLAKGQSVEVTGEWSHDQRLFLATRIEKLPPGRRPSARGAIDALDLRAARLRLFGQEIQVDQATVFAADSGGSEGHLADLMPGMRVEVSAEAGPTETWTAREIVWRGVKASDKVKGTITEVGPPAESEQTIQISGLGIRLTGETEIQTDYLEEELLGTLFSDEGDANVPHLGVGRLRLAGYGRMTTYRDDGYTFSGVNDDSLIGQPAIAVQAVGDWARSFQTLVDVRLGSDQSWEGNRFDVANARFEMLQAYAILRTPQAKGVMLMVGKQRVRDQREWLFDEYLDGARLYLTVTRPLVFEATYLPSVFPPPGEKFATWDDVVLRARFIPDARNEANVYWLKRQDSSPRRRQPVYWGLSYSGRAARWIRGWLEAALLRGEDKGLPQRAYAFDLGTTLTTMDRVRPSLTLSYALGSGEETQPGDPYSQEFRQTGYEDNSGRYGGFSSFKYYGEVLDPELSNIEVLTVGAGTRFGYSASVDAIFHVYRQHRMSDELRAALLLQPDGSSRDLGREVDFILGVQNLLKRASVAYGFGMFMPGDALRVSDQVATRHRVSVRVGF